MNNEKMIRGSITLLFLLVSTAFIFAQRLPVCTYSNLGVALEHEFVRLKFYRDTFQCITHDSTLKFTNIEALDEILCREAIYNRDHNIERKYHVILAFDSTTPFGVIDHVMMELKYEGKNLIVFLGQNPLGKPSGIAVLNPTIIVGMEYSKKYYGDRYQGGSDMTCYHKMFPEEKTGDIPPPPPPPPPPPTFKTIDPIGMYIKGKTENHLQGVAMITVKNNQVYMNGTKMDPATLLQQATQE